MACCAIPAVGICQSNPDQEPEPAPPNDIEEIIVQGQRNMGRLRLDMNLAEDHVFGLFNSLNSDDEFDIECRREAPTGSHIKRRVCEARFVRELTAEAARRYVDEGIYVPNREKMMLKQKQLRAEMDVVVAEHPEFLEALKEYSNAQERYQYARKKN